MLTGLESNESGVARIIARFRSTVALPPNGRRWLKRQLGKYWRREFRGAKPSMVFTGVKIEQLQFVVIRGEARDRLYRMTPVLERYVAIDCAPSIASNLISALEASGRVELAYRELGASIASFEGYPVSNASQLYLDKRPAGIDALYAWKFDGGTGAGVRFVDVEEAWNVFHEDLIDAGITLISGNSSGNPMAVDHGTAVLGVVAAQDNGKGVLGVANGTSSVRLSSLFQEDGKQNIALALFRAILELRFGDVLLLEVEAQKKPGSQPVEVERILFELIRLATALGIVVIQPAGNGTIDLDNLLIGHDGVSRSLNRASPDFQDSGALMVGGSLPSPSPNGVCHPRHSLSNFGSRVDCFCWAQGILTTWNSSVEVPPELFFLWGGRVTANTGFPVGDVDDDGPILVNQYHEFRGTSGAAAIVAGAAMCVQSLAQAHLGFRFSAWQLRLVLSDPANGTASLDPLTDRIGMMPDLRIIIDRVLRISVGAGGLFDPTSNDFPEGTIDNDTLLEASQSGEMADYVLLPFVANRGCIASSRPRRIEVISRLPREVSVWLEMPRDLADLEGVWRMPDIDKMENENVLVPVNPNGQTYFREAVFPETSLWRLVIEFSRAPRERPFEIVVRLLVNWQELSRLTWTIPCLS